MTLNNGVQMPLAGFGTFMLSGETCANAVTEASQCGYRMINTAEAYGNEQEVGEGIRRSGIDRRELFLVTKVNFKSYEHAEQTVMQSLESLQTDYIDLLLHWPFANYYAAWRALEKLYADGKIQAIGVSNFEPDQLLDLIAYNQIVPAVNQIETNIAYRAQALQSVITYRFYAVQALFIVEQAALPYKHAVIGHANLKHYWIASHLSQKRLLRFAISMYLITSTASSSVIGKDAPLRIVSYR